MSGFLCVDANVGTKWVLPELHSETARKLYADCSANDVEIVAPPHFKVEVVNSIRRRVARALISAGDGERTLQEFLRFTVSLASPPNLYQEALKLAEIYNRPAAYDSHYVALAQLYGCDLWTADERLLNALGGRVPFVKSLSNYTSLA